MTATRPVGDYVLLYHYSVIKELKEIDPRYYGESQLNTKAREGGLNKTYFYTVDKPEPCILSGATRYEIYLPCHWKNLIYDIGLDDDEIVLSIISELEENFKKYNCRPTQYAIKEGVEKRLYDLGYKGYKNGKSSLPAIVLFYAISTNRPSSYCRIYDWQGHVLEDNGIKSLKIFNIFCNPLLFNAYVNQLREEDNDWQLRQWWSVSA
jgi:hypothetical protein